MKDSTTIIIKANNEITSFTLSLNFVINKLYLSVSFVTIQIRKYVSLDYVNEDAVVRLVSNTARTISLAKSSICTDKN